MSNLLGGLLVSLIGTTIILNGASLDVANILDTTKEVVSETNLHQIRTAMELYYLEEGNYPRVNSGGEAIDLLAGKGYLKDKPASFSKYEYSSISKGKDYELNIK